MIFVALNEVVQLVNVRVAVLLIFKLDRYGVAFDRITVELLLIITSSPACGMPDGVQLPDVHQSPAAPPDHVFSVACADADNRMHARIAVSFRTMLVSYNDFVGNAIGKRLD